MIKGDLYQNIKSYADTLNNVFKDTDLVLGVMEILQKFILDENNVDTSVLAGLDPTIEQFNQVIEGMLKMSVPESLSTLHLELLNELQKMLEDLNGIQLYETDSIVALSAISQYKTNVTSLQSTVQNLSDVISAKLNY